MDVGFAVNNRTREQMSFFTIENTHAGEYGEKPPISVGDHSAHVKIGGKLKERIKEVDFVDINGTFYSAIEVHNGNVPGDSKGCTLVGSGLGNATDKRYDDKLEPAVIHSQPTLLHLMHVVKEQNPNPDILIETRREFEPVFGRSLGLNSNQAQAAEIAIIREKFKRHNVCEAPEGPVVAECNIPNARQKSTEHGK